MKKAILILAIFFLSDFLGASYSRALSDTVNVNALVPSEETSPGPAPIGGGGAIPFFDTLPPQISGVKITEITLHSALISWNTNENSSAYIYYGQTLSYEIGSRQAHPDTFISTHEIKLENLEANTRYYFQARSLDSAGNQSIKDGFEFRTLAEKKIIANIGEFKAVAGDGEIFLSWRSPLSADFQAMKILRREKFYPKSLEEGLLIYDGKENSFIDKNLVNGITYYYTVFAYDASGNYSSGAVAKAMPWKFGLPFPSPTLTPQISSSPVISPIVSVFPSPEIANLKLEDFNFSQGGKNLKITEGKIEVDSGKSLVVAIDVKKIPESVGTIMFILAQDGEPQSFLFKFDAAKNEYSVSFAPPDIGGVYSLTIAILDKNNNPAQAISGNLIVSVASQELKKSPWYIDWLWIFLIIFIILAARAAWRIYSKAR